MPGRRASAAQRRGVMLRAEDGVVESGAQQCGSVQIHDGSVQRSRELVGEVRDEMMIIRSTIAREQRIRDPPS